jgi:hypothetical protein
MVIDLVGLWERIKLQPAGVASFQKSEMMIRRLTCDDQASARRRHCHIHAA